MAIKTFKPYTKSRRVMTVVDFKAELTTDRPCKALTRKIKYRAGHNQFGHISSRFMGGGHKRRFRKIDFARRKDGIPARVATVEYDPYRSAFICLLNYVDGEKRYIIAPKGLRPGAMVMSGPTAEIRVGNTLPMSAIPVGTTVHCVELTPGRGAQVARGAGNACVVMAKEGDNITLRMPSGEMRKVNRNCRATVGEVGNSDHENVKIGKAGRSRWLGKRPHQRGVSMNPVDHPMGGGNGKSSGGRHSCDPWGGLSKGGKTRDPRKPSTKMIIKGRTR